MKSTKVQKIAIAFIIISFSLVIASNILLFLKIKEHGGLKETIIDAGKELKDINKEINKN